MTGTKVQTHIEGTKSDAVAVLGQIVADRVRHRLRWDANARMWLQRYVDSPEEWKRTKHPLFWVGEVLEPHGYTVRDARGRVVPLDWGSSAYMDKIERAARDALTVDPASVTPYVHPLSVGINDVRCPTCKVQGKPCAVKSGAHGKRVEFHRVLDYRLRAGLYTRLPNGEFDILADYFPKQSGTRTGRSFLDVWPCPYCGSSIQHDHSFDAAQGSIHVEAPCGLGMYTVRIGHHQTDHRLNHPRYDAQHDVSYHVRTFTITDAA